MNRDVRLSALAISQQKLGTTQRERDILQQRLAAAQCLLSMPSNIAEDLTNTQAELAQAQAELQQAQERIAELETRNAAMLHVAQAAIGVVDSEDPANANAITLYVPEDAWGRLGDAIARLLKERMGE